MAISLSQGVVFEFRYRLDAPNSEKCAFTDGSAWTYAYCCAFRGALYAA